MRKSRREQFIFTVNQSNFKIRNREKIKLLNKSNNKKEEKILCIRELFYPRTLSVPY